MYNVEESTEPAQHISSMAASGRKPKQFTINYKTDVQALVPLKNLNWSCNRVKEVTTVTSIENMCCIISRYAQQPFSVLAPTQSSQQQIANKYAAFPKMLTTVETMSHYNLA